MGVLQEIYKKYTWKYNFDASTSGLYAVGKLILCHIENGSDKCIVRYSDYSKQTHKYICYAMDEEFISTVPKNFDTYDFFRQRYVLSHQSHVVTASYLEKYQHPKFKAVTSLCYGSDSCFFHSYIWDTVENYIYDFSRNIIMKKEQFDEIFVYKQINVLSYDEYVDYLQYYEYMLCGEDYCRLMYLALVRLHQEEKGKEYVGPANLDGFFGRTFNGH